jgi:hypothetical protein
VAGDPRKLAQRVQARARDLEKTGWGACLLALAVGAVWTASGVLLVDGGRVAAGVLTVLGAALTLAGVRLVCQVCRYLVSK